MKVGLDTVALLSRNGDILGTLWRSIGLLLRPAVNFVLVDELLARRWSIDMDCRVHIRQSSGDVPDGERWCSAAAVVNSEV
ncbi:hypothetical protein M6B38_373800 [Iris pallida]|uniref:Uncharacterized protein n=1 Tax=Iris pallida TaxID=29817 RepID=A0AAX6GBG1_IRIPA|nr:hypothetical protein M6B38_373800 [Iris pallida]